MRNFLDVNQVGGAQERQFSTDMLFSRLNAYTAFRSSSHLHSFLRALEAEFDQQMDSRGMGLREGDVEKKEGNRQRKE